MYLNSTTQQQQHPFNGPFPRLPRWAGTRKVKPIWILLKQETVSGSGFSWTICKSAPHSRQITMPAPHHSVFYRPDALPAAEPTASKHWRHWVLLNSTTQQQQHPFNGPFPRQPRWAGTRKVNQSGFYWSKRQSVAVASAGPYASLHLAPDR